MVRARAHPKRRLPGKGGRDRCPPPEGGLLLVEGEAPAAQAAVKTVSSRPVAAANSVVLRNRGLELLEGGRPEESLKELRSALRLDPHDFVAWRAVLLALEKLGRKQELQEAVSEIAATFGAGLVVSHFALVLRESGHRALAERLFESAAELAPGRSDVWSSLGNLAYDRRDFDGARSWLAGPPVGAPSQIQLVGRNRVSLPGQEQNEWTVPGPADKGALCRLDSCFGYTVDEPHWSGSGGRS